MFAVQLGVQTVEQFAHQLAHGDSKMRVKQGQGVDEAGTCIA